VKEMPRDKGTVMDGGTNEGKDKQRTEESENQKEEAEVNESWMKRRIKSRSERTEMRRQRMEIEETQILEGR